VGSSRYGRPDHVLMHCDGSDTAADTANDTEESSGVENEDPDRPSFSLVTGKYRQARRFGVGGTTLLPFHLDRFIPRLLFLSVSMLLPVPGIGPKRCLFLQYLR